VSVEHPLRVLHKFPLDPLVAEPRSMPTTTHGFGRCLAMAIFLFIHATFARQLTLIARES
jgi:hypothetical protein